MTMMSCRGFEFSLLFFVVVVVVVGCKLAF